MTEAQQDIFVPYSEASESALQQLAVVLDQLGFTVRKKSSNESTLRVYPRGYGQYPLINPRFEPDAMYGGTLVNGSFLECDVWSKGDDRLDNVLRGFLSNPECEFVATGRRGKVYFHHGDLVLPVRFTNPQSDEIDFASLGRSLQAVRDHLQKSL